MAENNPFNPLYGVTTDDFGNPVDYTFDAAGNPMSPSGQEPGMTFDTKELYGAANGDRTSSDEEIAKFKEKGYIFLENGDIWNASQSTRVGSWDVEEYYQEQIKAGKDPKDIKASLEGGATFGPDGHAVSRTTGSTTGPGGTKAPGARTSTPPPTAPPTRSRTDTGVPTAAPPPGNDPGPPPPIGPAGPTGIDPNAPMGIEDPGARSVPLGEYFNQSRGGLGQLPSVFDGLDKNSTLRDIIANIQRSSEATSQGQQDIFSGLFDESLNSRESVNERGLINKILENPESMDPATVSRIMGAQNQAIGQRASQQAQLARDSAASMGVGRDIGQREANRAIREGAAQQTEAERATRIDAAKTNFGDRLNALQGAGAAGARQRSERVGIGSAASDTMGTNRANTDLFLTNALLTDPSTPKIAGYNNVTYNTTAPNYSY